MMIGAGQPIGYDDRPVRYRSRQMNPEGTKPQGSSFSSELIAIHGVTFHGAAAVSWVQLVQLSVGGWFIWSLGFSCVLRSCPTHVHSIFHHFIILLILYLPAPLFTISCSCNNCPFHAEIWGQYNLAAAFRKDDATVMSTLGSESVLGHRAQLENQAILASDEILRDHFVKTRNTRSSGLTTVDHPWGRKNYF